MCGEVPRAGRLALLLQSADDSLDHEALDRDGDYGENQRPSGGIELLLRLRELPRAAREASFAFGFVRRRHGSRRILVVVVLPLFLARDVFVADRARRFDARIAFIAPGDRRVVVLERARA